MMADEIMEKVVKYALWAFGIGWGLILASVTLVCMRDVYRMMRLKKDGRVCPTCGREWPLYTGWLHRDSVIGHPKSDMIVKVFGITMWVIFGIIVLSFILWAFWE